MPILDIDLGRLTRDLEVACSIGIVLVKLVVAIFLPSSKRLDIERECELMLGPKDIDRETLGGLATCSLDSDDGGWGGYDRSHILW